MISKTLAVLAIAAAVSGCQVKKSSNPLSPSVAGPIPGVSITTPGPSSPAAGARIPTNQQPITLTVGNAVTSGVRPISYLFEVASDAAFATILVSQADIRPDASGSTSFRLPAALPSDKVYFWRARAQDGANTGNFATPSSFTVYTPIVIGGATPVSPANGAAVTSLTPQLTFNNVSRSGPVGTIRYFVLLYNDTVSATTGIGAFPVTEGAGGQTSFTVPASVLAVGGRTYYWGVLATDGTNEGPISGFWSFRSPATPATPTPAPGGGSAGSSSSDFAGLGRVTIVGGSPDVSTFPVTSQITALRFSPGNIHLRHTKTGQWPGVDIGGALQEATLWVFFRINGQWYATGAERWRPGQTDKALSAPSAIGPGWFYGPAWAPMTNYVPRVGEQVGFMVVAGSTRADTRTPVRERSAILMVPFPADGVTASYP